MREGEPEDWARLSAFPGAAPFEGYPSLLACDGADIAAFLIFRRVAPDEAEILYLETAEQYRRRGLARRLVREFQKRNPGQLFLEVRESNGPARQLYISEGFREISVRKGYYNSPHEGAIVMKFYSC